MKILEVKDISKNFGGVRALSNLSFSLEEGQITGLIGSNGAGKTTIFNVITGFLKSDSGQIIYKGEDITGLAPIKIVKKGICRTFQELRLFGKLSVFENICLGIPDQSEEKFMTALIKPPKVRKERAAVKEKVEGIIDYVGLTPYTNYLAESLAYGEQKLLSLGRFLATGADTLLLDEPTSGLDGRHIDNILEVVRKLTTSGKTICLIEHNMEVVSAVSSYIYVLDQGTKLAEGFSKDVMNDPQVLSIYLGGE
ncbi:MAG: ABC transporter ATP-binding protein [Clostridiales bacterium]|nr:ABC transporter ATP-binding protein [Clostridiales bacterium]